MKVRETEGEKRRRPTKRRERDKTVRDERERENEMIEEQDGGERECVLSTAVRAGPG